MPITNSTEFSREEVGLALRNPGMPLEALRREITPIGMHYVLVHFDIPDVDPTTYELVVDGLVGKPAALTLDDLRERPAVSMPVMMECAGSGRGAPRAASGLRALARRGGGLRGMDGNAPARGARGGGPAGRCRGGAVHRLGPRHRPGCRAGLSAQPDGGGGDARGRPVGLRDERAAAAAGPRLPGSADRSRLVRHGLGEVAAVDHGHRGAVRGRAAVTALPLPRIGGGSGHAGHAQEAARADGAPGNTGVLLAEPAGARRPHPAWRAGRGPDPMPCPACSSAPTAGRPGRTPASKRRTAGTAGPPGPTSGTSEEPGDYELCVRATDAAGNAQPLDSTETWNQGGYGVNAVQRVAVRVVSPSVALIRLTSQRDRCPRRRLGRGGGGASSARRRGPPRTRASRRAR